MRTDEPRAIHLADYKAPEFRIRTVHLDFALSPEATRVTSRLEIARQTGSGERYAEEHPHRRDHRIDRGRIAWVRAVLSVQSGGLRWDVLIHPLVEELASGGERPAGSVWPTPRGGVDQRTAALGQ